MLKAICSGFKERTEPAICLNAGQDIFPRVRYLYFVKNILKIFSWSILKIEIETNECLEANGGCWQDKKFNVTACKVYRHKERYTKCFSGLYHLFFIDYMNFIRTHLGEEYASVRLSMVFNIKEMVIPPASVCFYFRGISLHIFVPWYWKIIHFLVLDTAYGPARCSMNDGGCWSETRKDLTFSACSVKWLQLFLPLN